MELIDQSDHPGCKLARSCGIHYVRLVDGNKNHTGLSEARKQRGLILDPPSQTRQIFYSEVRHFASVLPHERECGLELASITGGLVYADSPSS